MVFVITLQTFLESAHIFLGPEETCKCMRYAIYVYPKRPTTRRTEHMKRLLLYQLKWPLTWYHEVGDELHIRKVDNAKPGLRHRVAKLSGIGTKHCSSEASVGYAADSQQGFDQGLIPIISVGVP